jgi:hypothetical protein
MALTLRLPRVYGVDAEERLDYPVYESMRFVRANRQFVWLELSCEAARDLLSDARYYADPNGPGEGPEYRDLKTSARRAIPIIEAALASCGEATP